MLSRAFQVVRRNRDDSTCGFVLCMPSKWCRRSWNQLCNQHLLIGSYRGPFFHKTDEERRAYLAIKDTDAGLTPCKAQSMQLEQAGPSAIVQPSHGHLPLCSSDVRPDYKYRNANRRLHKCPLTLFSKGPYGIVLFVGIGRAFF